MKKKLTIMLLGAVLGQGGDIHAFVHHLKGSLPNGLRRIAMQNNIKNYAQKARLFAIRGGKDRTTLKTLSEMPTGFSTSSVVGAATHVVAKVMPQFPSAAEIFAWHTAQQQNQMRLLAGIAKEHVSRIVPALPPVGESLSSAFKFLPSQAATAAPTFLQKKFMQVYGTACVTGAAAMKAVADYGNDFAIKMRETFGGDIPAATASITQPVPVASGVSPVASTTSVSDNPVSQQLPLDQATFDSVYGALCNPNTPVTSSLPSMPSVETVTQAGKSTAPVSFAMIQNAGQVQDPLAHAPLAHPVMPEIVAVSPVTHSTPTVTLPGEAAAMVKQWLIDHQEAVISSAVIATAAATVYCVHYNINPFKKTYNYLFQKNKSVKA